MSHPPQSETMVTRLLELARLDPKYLEDLQKFRRSLVVMFTDIRGSTAYFEEHGDVAGLMLVHECNSMIRREVEGHSGKVIKSIGDGMMATFDDCSQAAAAAVAMQRALQETNKLREPNARPAIRIGLHYGTGIVKSNDVFGDVVNTASRVESVAVPGQIVASEEFRHELPPTAFPTQELGRFLLKGKANERLLFQILWEKPADAPSGTPGRCGYKVELIKRDGTVEAEHRLETSITISGPDAEICIDGEERVSHPDARIFLDNDQVWVDSLGSDAVFVRVSAAYTLRDGDIVVMGNEVFRFRENAAVLSAATMVGAKLDEIAGAVSDAVAELVLLDAEGNGAQRFPLTSESVTFGRTRGDYSFTEDKLMSRLHATILQRGEDFVIEDAHSRNGTFVKVSGTAVLAVGSAVLVGNRLLRLAEDR